MVRMRTLSVYLDGTDEDKSINTSISGLASEIMRTLNIDSTKFREWVC